MTIYVEWNDMIEAYEVTQAGGLGVLTTKQSRDKAISAARRYTEPGEDVAVKGPRMSSFKQV